MVEKEYVVIKALDTLRD